MEEQKGALTIYRQCGDDYREDTSPSAKRLVRVTKGRLHRDLIVYLNAGYELIGWTPEVVGMFSTLSWGEGWDRCYLQTDDSLIVELSEWGARVSVIDPLSSQLDTDTVCTTFAGHVEPVEACRGDLVLASRGVYWYLAGRKPVPFWVYVLVVVAAFVIVFAIARSRLQAGSTG